MCKTLVWGLKMILCVGLILVGIGPLGLAQNTDDSAGKETQLADNKIVRILYDKYGVAPEEIKKYRVTDNLGYGEILILYALADRILEDGILEEIEDEGTGIGDVITKILDQRANKGWGQIAQEYGLKLGQVVSSVMKREKGTEETEETTEIKETKDDTEENGGDHKQGKKNKAKNDKEHPGKGKGRGKGKGKK